MKCPHCGVLLTLGLELAETPIPKKPSGMCACGHERSFHENGSGPCGYGTGSFHGGCDCADYHTRKRKTEAPRPPATGELSKCARALLVSLFQSKNSIADIDEVAIRAGYSVTSGSTAAALTALRAADLVQGASSCLSLTQAGLARSQEEEPLSTAPSVLDYWTSEVGTCAGALLREIVRVHPHPYDREELAQRTGYSPTSGSFAAALTELRRLRLVDGLTATKALMASVAR